MIAVRAFAKINLDLRIVGGLAGGYHELRTTFQSIALHDRLTFTARRGSLVIESDDPACPVDGNIVERAASLVWKASGRSGSPAGMRVRIEKRIPVAAGLGGGSADAAAALAALARLWSVRLTPSQLREMAASLGADVPFFLVGGTARGTGRGDALAPLADRTRRWVVVATPPFGVSTKDAFRWFDEADTATPHAGRPVLGQRLRRGPHPLNDLQPPVAVRHPQIGELIDELRRHGGSPAAMSGSGSAVFGLFARLSSAETAADALVGHGRRVLLTRTLSRHEHRRLSRPGLARK